MNKVFSTPFFDRWMLFAIGLSLTVGLLASEAYRALAEYSFRADFAARVQREAASFYSRTVVGRGMGMVALAGLVDPTIRDAALETDIERAKSQRTHHEALRVLAAAADRLILAVQLNPPVPAWAGRDLAALVAELRRVGSPAPVRPLDAPPRCAPQFFALAGDPREALG